MNQNAQFWFTEKEFKYHEAVEKSPPNGVHPPTFMNYYISVGGEQKGPYTKDQLSRMWDTGAVTADTQYWTDGMTGWMRLEDLFPSSAVRTAGRVLGRAWGNLVFAKRPQVKGGAMPPVLPAENLAYGSRDATRSTKLGMAARLIIAGSVVVTLMGFIFLALSDSKGSWGDSRTYQQNRQEPVKTENVEQSYTPPPRNTYPDEIRQWLMNSLHDDLNKHKQALFDALHPTGTARNAKVTDVTVRWKNGTPGRQWEDITAYTVHFVLYWRGPITTDGYTQVDWTFDTVLERFTSYRVVRSNGITKDDLAGAFEDLAKEAVKSWIDRSP